VIYNAISLPDAAINIFVGNGGIGAYGPNTGTSSSFGNYIYATGGGFRLANVNGGYGYPYNGATGGTRNSGIGGSTTVFYNAPGGGGGGYYSGGQGGTGGSITGLLSGTIGGTVSADTNISKGTSTSANFWQFTKYYLNNTNNLIVASLPNLSCTGGSGGAGASTAGINGGVGGSTAFGAGGGGGGGGRGGSYGVGGWGGNGGAGYVLIICY
jgi:hypothetical protein